MPKINFKNDGARQWALDVTEHWIKNFDIDGWRMDVAKELDFSFWKDFRDVAYSDKKRYIAYFRNIWRYFTMASRREI